MGNSGFISSTLSTLVLNFRWQEGRPQSFTKPAAAKTVQGLVFPGWDGVMGMEKHKNLNLNQAAFNLLSEYTDRRRDVPAVTVAIQTGSKDCCDDGGIPTANPKPETLNLKP